MSRRTFLRRAGLGLGTVAVVGAGVVAYRAYDQGVLEAEQGPAYEPWTTWRDGPGLLPLVGAATLAPSPHNAQAWLFEVGANHIDVYADRSRGTGALDPYLREMRVGLGAALENLVLAARTRGLAPTVVLLPNGPRSNHAAHVVLTDAPRQPSDLAAQLSRRHTNRYPYVRDRRVPKGALASMEALADPGFSEARVIWLTEPSRHRRMSELLVEATEAIVADPEQGESDYRWFRQDWDQIQRERDGITIDAAGLPDLTATLAKLLPAQSKSAMGEAWIDATRERHTATAAAYGVVAVRDALDPVQQLHGGRLLERVHLWATGHDIALQHMNQVTERADREAQLGVAPRFGTALAQLLPSGWQALSAFRIGYPTQEARRSPRRSVDAVLVR